MSQQAIKNLAHNKKEAKITRFSKKKKNVAEIKATDPRREGLNKNHSDTLYCIEKWVNVSIRNTNGFVPLSTDKTIPKWNEFKVKKGLRPLTERSFYRHLKKLKEAGFLVIQRYKRTKGRRSIKLISTLEYNRNAKSKEMAGVKQENGSTDNTITFKKCQECHPCFDQKWQDSQGIPILVRIGIKEINKENFILKDTPHDTEKVGGDKNENLMTELEKIKKELEAEKMKNQILQDELREERNVKKEKVAPKRKKDKYAPVLLREKNKAQYYLDMYNEMHESNVTDNYLIGNINDRLKKGATHDEIETVIWVTSELRTTVKSDFLSVNAIFGWKWSTYLKKGIEIRKDRVDLLTIHWAKLYKEKTGLPLIIDFAQYEKMLLVKNKLDAFNEANDGPEMNRERYEEGLNYLAQGYDLIPHVKKNFNLNVIRDKFDDILNAIKNPQKTTKHSPGTRGLDPIAEAYRRSQWG